MNRTITKRKVTLKKVVKDWEPEFAKTNPMADKKKANKPKVKAVKGPRIPEKDIQDQVDNYLRVLGIKPIRMPDALFRSIYAKGNGVKLHIKSQIANSIAGLPDLIIPLITEKGTLILPLELKAIGGELGPKQIKWQKHLGTVVAYSFEEAKILIDDFLKGV